MVEAASLVAFVLGIYLAVKFTQVVTELTYKMLNTSSKLLPFIVFALITIIIVTGIHLVSKLITALLESMKLGWLNKIAGGVFGVGRSVFIWSTLLYFFASFYLTAPLISGDKPSVVYSYIKDIAPRFLPMEKWVAGMKQSISPV
jgi:membrane protein required for colicin V production